MEPKKMRARLRREGISVGSDLVPLLSGSVHYWRLDPLDWKRALEATRDLGVRLVDTYVPWGVHEIAPGRFDFGETDPRLDIAAFLRLAQELGLYAIVRPGPHVNAELTYFGLPERIVWDPACQARSPGQNPVVLPMVPVGFPVPSYASEAFLLEVETWFRAVAPRLAPLRHPEGPIVLCQVDNEGAFYFRDGAYDQDYRPEAVAAYRAFLETKYPTRQELDAVYGGKFAGVPEVDPPTSWSGDDDEPLAWHLDWAEFQEELLAASLTRMAQSLALAGLDELPTMHNFPMVSEATPLNGARVRRAVDFIGLDYYHRAGPIDRAAIERRTTELVTRAEGWGTPAFACEMGAGLPPFFFPIPDEVDNRFTALTALAYGLRGFNIYMAVERDRWIGAPIDQRGNTRPSAAFFRRLDAALEKVAFHTLLRPLPVRIVAPAIHRRLRRILFAFTPTTPALFALTGAGARESCFEDDLGGAGPELAAIESFCRLVEERLAAHGTHFGYAEGASAPPSLSGARFILCPTSGSIDADLWQALLQAKANGARVAIGPRRPEYDAAMRPLGMRFEATGFELVGGTIDAVDAAIGRALAELGIEPLSVSPETAFATVHEDGGGKPRVLFAINPSGEPVTVRVRIAAREAVDLLDDSRFASTPPELCVPVGPRSVRMLALDPA
jgi:beta-galactosidase